MPCAPRLPRTGFRPRFTLMLVYAFVFFLLYALLIALPPLLELLGPHLATKSGEELQRAATEISRRAMGGGRLSIALLLALATVGLAARFRALPGLR
jgi:hypothetical protein